MSIAERGLYRELLDYCWLEGSIPSDEKTLIKLSATSKREFLACWPAVKPKFFEADGRLHHPKVDECRPKLEEWAEARRRAGSKGGRAKAKGVAIAKASATAIALADLKPSTTTATSTAILTDPKEHTHTAADAADVLLLSPPEPVKKRRAAKAYTNGESQQFQEFFALYPKEDGRKGAWAEYRKAIKLASPEVILEGLKRRLPELEEIELCYRKRAGAWLEDRGWEKRAIAPGVPKKKPFDIMTDID